MFALAIFNMLTLTYYLLIDSYEGLEIIFPSFTSYVLIFSVIVVPLLIFLGIAHMRKTAAYQAEMEVSIKSNPYMYKLPPGHEREAIAPLLLELLILLRKPQQSKLNDDELEKIEELEEKLEFLAKGGTLERKKKIDDL